MAATATVVIVTSAKNAMAQRRQASLRHVKTAASKSMKANRHVHRGHRAKPRKRANRVKTVNHAKPRNNVSRANSANHVNRVSRALPAKNARSCQSRTKHCHWKPHWQPAPSLSMVKRRKLSKWPAIKSKAQQKMVANRVVVVVVAVATVTVVIANQVTTSTLKLAKMM